ncbi:hypothetical protein [Aquabacter spiritensis]|uniref:Uncharacterized protein n=1 Tax=Aquabacter spiritensis TaxID=933073 RepID=A0A4R3M366_9HYPH|nr:hypothetical protein [Aquabacter spiritensis]TCT07661.1 hypothetical protein EDC64_101180 [Aquabacter spiritensis]
MIVYAPVPESFRPLKVAVSGSSIVLRSLEDAAAFMRGHPVGEHAEMLLDQMESASGPDLQRRAWRAFETFADAMRLTPEAQQRIL